MIRKKGFLEPLRLDLICCEPRNLGNKTTSFFILGSWDERIANSELRLFNFTSFNKLDYPKIARILLFVHQSERKDSRKMSGFTLSSLKNTFDEVRSQYYPKNETEKKVRLFAWIILMCSLQFRFTKHFLLKIGALPLRS
jgi:hypothetical protein